MQVWFWLVADIVLRSSLLYLTSSQSVSPGFSTPRKIVACRQDRPASSNTDAWPISYCIYPLARVSVLETSSASVLRKPQVAVSISDVEATREASLIDDTRAHW